MSPSNKKTHDKAKKPVNTALCTANIMSPLYTSSTKPITHIAFHEFIKLTNLESIKHFLITAAFTPEG